MKRQKPDQEGRRAAAKKWIITIISVVFLIVAIDIFGRWGFFGWLLIVVGISIISMVRNWKTIKQTIMMCMRMIETPFFGKPLDKDLWKKGEFKKKKKVKIVWRKKDEKENQKDKTGSNDKVLDVPGMVLRSDAGGQHLLRDYDDDGALGDPALHEPGRDNTNQTHPRDVPIGKKN